MTIFILLVAKLAEVFSGQIPVVYLFLLIHLLFFVITSRCIADEGEYRLIAMSQHQPVGCGSGSGELAPRRPVAPQPGHGNHSHGNHSHGPIAQMMRANHVHSHKHIHSELDSSSLSSSRFDIDWEAKEVLLFALINKKHFLHPWLRDSSDRNCSLYRNSDYKIIFGTRGS